VLFLGAVVACGAATTLGLFASVLLGGIHLHNDGEDGLGGGSEGAYGLDGNNWEPPPPPAQQRKRNRQRQRLERTAQAISQVRGGRSSAATRTAAAIASTTSRHLPPMHRYDLAAPKPIPGTARSHSLPNAVPLSRTIPRHLAEVRSYHLSQRRNFSNPWSVLPRNPPRWVEEPWMGEYNWNHSYGDDHRTLYLMNPSVVPLFNTEQSNHPHADDDPDNLSPADLHLLTGSDPKVRYLATYRAYTGCNCFGPDPHHREIMNAGEQLSYLALALLDAELNVVEGTDVLIDLNAGPRRTKYWRQPLEDCRANILRGGMYLVCNEEMLRVTIVRRQQSDGGGGGSGARSGAGRTKRERRLGRRDDHTLPYVCDNVYGDGLQITLVGRDGKVGGGKNFNVFRSRAAAAGQRLLPAGAATNHGADDEITTGMYDYYLQTYPVPHRYRRLVIADGHQKQSPPSPELRAKHPDWPDRGPDDPVAPGPIPPPSFATPDAAHRIQRCAETDDGDRSSTNCTMEESVSVPFFGDDDHGSACCVRMTIRLPNGGGKRRRQEVMVGVSHQKTSPRKPFWKDDLYHRYDDESMVGVDRFVSRFVAYDPSPPFDIVALSGWWCLGFADEAEAEAAGGGNTLAGRNTQARLDLFNDTYACPIIHFVSTLAEVVGNADRAILGYGVNDCHPRMFMVEKSDIARLLEGNVMDGTSSGLETDEEDGGARSAVRIAIEASLDKVRLADLQGSLRKRGLRATGSKEELQTRLVDALLEDGGFGDD